MAVTRIREWHTALHIFIELSREKPFVWGGWDCCLSAADLIHSFTGVDLAEAVRGKYTDEESAFALIKSLTGGSTAGDAVAWCATKHGPTEYEYPLLAKRGDLAVVKNGDGHLIAGVVGLDGRHVLTAGNPGFIPILITNIVRAWAV